MDAVSYSLASKQAQRIEKFIENPDSTSGIITVPKVIASGENITIPTGRVAVLPNVQVDGTLNIEGEVFVPSGATFGDIENQIALKAPLLSPDFTGNPTAPTQTAGNNSTRLATTAYVDGKMVLGTAVNSTSGTSIDFTGIPSWVKRITVMFNGVSTNGTSHMIIRLGSAGSIKTTGYVASSAFCQINASTTGGVLDTTGFPIFSTRIASAHSGLITFVNQGNNIWVASGVTDYGMSDTITSSILSSGKVELSSTLDRIRITTVNGTDTFDAGSINIMYEG